MTEERRDCTKCINNDGCHIHCICHNQDKWQPIAQEKPMENKVIFESEEQLRKFVDDCIFIDEDKNDMYDIVQSAKIGNYIRKSAVEEAEEYEKHFARIMDLGLSCTIKDLEYSMRIIERLKSEIERLKG